MGIKPLAHISIKISISQTHRQRKQTNGYQRIEESKGEIRGREITTMCKIDKQHEYCKNREL